MPRSSPCRKHLYLPAKDRSFWKAPTELPLLYLAWGRRDFSKQRIPESQHEGWVCVLIEAGRPKLSVCSKVIPLTAGTLVFIGPDCPFGWASTDDSECKFSVSIWAGLNSEELKKDFAEDYTYRSLPQKKQEPFRILHDLCRREVLHFDAYSHDYLEGCRLQFESLLLRTLESRAEDDNASARIELATNWMQAHLDSNEPVARLCDYLNLSQSSLHRLFKTKLKSSPAQHFYKLKMEHAKILLQGGELQVKEVAFKLGYQHFNDFSRGYKKYFGKAPSETSLH